MPTPTLAQIIDGLPEEERFILTIHILKGRSSAEIASALGVPVSAVNNMIAIGKARLLSALNFED